MASSSTRYILMIIITSFFSMQYHTPLALQFEVGGKDGWAIPPPKNHHLYNDWASENRFRVNDTLHFKYQKDSVLEVTQEDYDKCRSDHPLFYSNNGNTSYRVERSGLFFFTSGVSGHCERGLKMIIKVLEEQAASPPQSANETASNSAVTKRPAAVVMMFIFSLFGAVCV